MKDLLTSRPAFVFNGSGFFWVPLCFILVLGLLVRLLSWSTWPFLDGPSLLTSRPLLGNADGYFYLTLARDLIEGAYHTTESLRVFPETPPRPDPVPLLAFVTAWLTRLTTLPIELVAGFLPTLLGSLIAFPVAIICREIGGRLVALTAAGFSVLMPYFAHRSSLGWYDTDPLNVGLPLGMAAVATVFLRKAVHAREATLGMLIYAGLIVLLFYWWDQAPHIVALVTAYPLLLVLGIRWDDRFLRYGSLALVALIITMLPMSPTEVVGRNIQALSYVTKQADAVFSPTAIAIGEQQKLPWAEFVREAAGGPIMLFLSVVGFAYLGRRRPVLLLPLAPFLIIGTFGYSQAERFLIFLSPLVAIGLSGLFPFIRDHLPRTISATLIASLSIVFAMVLVAAGDHRGAAPIVPLAVVEHMTRIPEELPENAVLWNLCDYGYALTYWSRRATVCDGSSHTPALRTFTAAPLYADSPLQSARFVHFYIAHGHAGMERILARHEQNWPRTQAFLKTIHSMSAGTARKWISENWSGLSSVEIDDWVSFLFPPEIRPVYVVLDRQTMRNTHWWFWFSSWDPERGAGIHPNYILFPEIPAIGEGGLIHHPDNLFTIDTHAGIVKFSGRTVTLRTLNRIGGEHQGHTDYPHEGHWILDIMSADGYGVLHDPFTHSKVGHRLYLQTVRSPLFETVFLAGPEFQLWRVHHPDTLSTEPIGSLRRP